MRYSLRSGFCALLFCVSAHAEGAFEMADASPDAPHFMSLDQVRMGLAPVKNARPVASAPSVSNTNAVATPALKGFIPFDRSALVPVRNFRTPTGPSTTSISSSLAAAPAPTSLNHAPGANPSATSPTLQLFGMEDAPSNNFYKALGVSPPTHH